MLSEEIWFRTTTTTGGKLIGFGDTRTGGTSTKYDRHIWMSTDGKLNFGTNTATGFLGANVQNNIVSPLAYNDDKWHHAAATLSAGGIRLYVDGVSIANDPTVTGAEVYNGYFRIGWDSLLGWFPVIGPTSTNHFNGQLSNAAVYINKTLTAPQV